MAKIKAIPPSTVEESYSDQNLKKEIKAYFDDTDLKAGDIVKYTKDQPFNLLRREAEFHRLDIFYCAPGSPEFKKHGEYTFKVEDRKYLKETEEMTEIHTQEHFESLKVGDQVHKVTEDRSRGLRVVGRMPGSNVYIILSDGEHLEHLYIPNNTCAEADAPGYKKWFIGKYDSKKVGKVMLKNLERRKKSVEDIYIKED